jgi:hypothetical protein
MQPDDTTKNNRTLIRRDALKGLAVAVTLESLAQSSESLN